MEPRGYSHAIKVKGGTLLFIAGQGASNLQGEIVGKGDMRSQLKQVLENIKAVLEEAGGTFDDVVKTTIFVTSIDEFFKASDIGKEYYGKILPTGTLVEIKRLAREDMMVEIEAIAVIEDKD